jgi:hypothetical protein
MPRVIHFEINADDPERAVRFYEQAFGWRIGKWSGPIEYWLVSTGEEGEPGIDGAIMRREGSGGTYNTIDVPSVDEYVARITAAGGKALAPKTAIPGVGWFCRCADTEGNVFGIMQTDPEAR